MTTGVFFHPEFRNKDWPIIGDKFRNFPEVIERAVPEDRVRFYESRPATQFLPRVRAFKPFMVLHNLGHDTALGDYGDRGLTRAFFPRLAALVRSCADEVCAGRYLVITHGGARPDIAEEVFPAVAQVLTGQRPVL